VSTNLGMEVFPRVDAYLKEGIELP
jgi:hypothetical protein